jgi:hypothetical protein
MVPPVNKEAGESRQDLQDIELRLLNETANLKLDSKRARQRLESARSCMAKVNSILPRWKKHCGWTRPLSSPPRLKARVVIYAYNHHVQLLSTRVEEPTFYAIKWLLVRSQKHKESDWTVSVEIGISGDYYCAVRDTEI